MEELLESIERIRFENRNFEGRYFIPDNALFNVISEPAITRSLGSLGFPPHEIGGLADGILHGARKCFAILTLIGHGKAISGFFRRDSLQRSCPDDRLPYTSEALQQILEVDTSHLMIKRFWETQREFTTPILHQHLIYRDLDKETILPFLHEKSIGRGSMGTAWQVQIHQQCHQLPLKDHMASV